MADHAQTDGAGMPPVPKNASEQAALPQVPAKSTHDQHPRRASFIDNITSHLGPLNPFSHAVDSENQLVWLLDNTAYQTPGSSEWRVDLTAAFFEKHSGYDISSTVAEISEKLGIADDDAETKDRITKRLLPLFNTILPAHTAEVSVGGKDETGKDVEVARTTLLPSNRNGISITPLVLKGQHSDGETAHSAVLGTASSIPASTMYAKSTGWGIISDIDDTIKKTLTDSVTGILQTTFCDEPEPIRGMPEFYKHLNEKLQKPPFWYLSASPYNLYAFLHKFRDQYFPPGTIYLREASWQNTAGFLLTLRVNTREYKDTNMELIHKAFPGKKFVCIGDSTQSDPEAYADMYRKFPGWIGAIFIRKVLNVTEVTDPLTPGDDEKKRNSDERFATAFKGVPKDVWYVFEEPEELYEKVDKLIV